MAKKKEVKDIEVLADIHVLNEIKEAIEEASVESQVAEAKEETEASVESQVAEAKEETEASVETLEVVEDVVEQSVEEVFGDKDLVTFINNNGQLRTGQYGYISKRGYKAIEKYKSKK